MQRSILGCIGLIASMALAIARPVTAAETAKPEEAFKRFAAAMVRVEYWLQFDRGEAPRSQAGGQRCPRCGQMHGDTNGEELVNQERPFTTAGYLVAPKQVLSTDPCFHPRFIKSIRVVRDDKSVGAKIGAYAANVSAIQLDLASPLGGAKPLEIGGGDERPVSLATYGLLEGLWTPQLRPIDSTFIQTRDGTVYRYLSDGGLLLAASGAPIAIWLENKLPTDDSWRTPFGGWEWVEQQSYEEQIEALQKGVWPGLVRVDLRFRSPSSKGPRHDRFDYDDMDEEDYDGSGRTSQDRNVIGLMISDRLVLVLCNMKPARTARLDRIEVDVGDGKSVAAMFRESLRDYGAFVAELKTPITRGVIRFSQGDVRELINRMVFSAEVRVQGKRRVVHSNRFRIRQFESQFKDRIYPSNAFDGERDALVFLFNRDGELLALSLQPRKQVTEQERYSSNIAQLTPAGYVAAALADLPANADAQNRPQTEADENRLAWLGVELQGMNRELARANEVSEETNDGQSGALVSYVYPDSPAEKAGITPGAVLLRLYVDGLPKPLDVKIESYGEGFGMGGIPWDRLEQAPVEMLADLPPPWPSVENSFNRSLTDLGAGRKIQVELFQDGKPIRKDFEVVLGPPHFGSSPQFKSKPMGITVRDLTYEVRRFLQRSPGDPGVIVSRVEPGGKAAVAKILPFEVITHVNNEPVKNAKEFEKLCENQSELRLSVLRMSQSRAVKIRLGKSKGGNTTGPATTGPASGVPAQSNPASASPIAR